MNHRRCVFRDNPDPNEAEFFEKLMQVIHTLGEDGVRLELMSDETSNVTKLHQMMWQATDDELQTELSIVRDLHDEVCYATIKSKHAWIVKRAEELFTTTIDCYQIDELITECQRRFFDTQARCRDYQDDFCGFGSRFSQSQILCSPCCCHHAVECVCSRFGSHAQDGNRCQCS